MEILPYVEPLSPVFVNVDDTHTAAGFQIPESQYKDVQKFFNPVLAEGCMSLMAAGEIIRTYAFQSSRDAMLKLQSVIAQTVPELYGPSARYFITLGILIVDEVFRHNLQTQRTKAENLLARLSDPRDDSITISPTLRTSKPLLLAFRPNRGKRAVPSAYCFRKAICIR